MPNRSTPRGALRPDQPSSNDSAAPRNVSKVEFEPGPTDQSTHDTCTGLCAHDQASAGKQHGLYCAITYHLIDSLPGKALRRRDARLRRLAPGEREAERRRLIESCADRGRGCCILAEPQAAACIVDTWRRFAGQRYDMIAWVVMPNHVHVLIRAYDGASVGRIVQSWKSHTSRRIASLLAARAEVPAWLSPARSIWLRDYWHRCIQDEPHLRAAVRYIHANPVRAGLVREPIDWPWSSAKAFAGSPG